jgi:signal transduction histidine kinase
LNLAYHGARAQDQRFNITMERDFDRNIPPIDAVPQDMTRVFLNLIGNGFYATRLRSREGETTFRPVLKVTTSEVGDGVEIRVRDNGIGIPPEYREKLFQPFFTTKPTGEGTGLGLSISYEVITQQHGDHGRQRSRSLHRVHGTVAATPASSGGEGGMSVSILTVDDEADVAELFRQHFRREVRQDLYVLHFAGSAEEALDKLNGGIQPVRQCKQRSPSIYCK